MTIPRSFLMPGFLAVLALAACDKAPDGAVTGTKNVSRPPAVQPQAPQPAAGTTRSGILQTCLDQNAEAGRPYCECYADQMDRRLGGGASQEERGRASVAAAMACRDRRAQ